MSAGEGVRCRFDDLRRATALAGAEPVAILEAATAAETPGLLAAVDAEVEGGRWAAGFVAYEAAPAFDPALEVRSETAGLQARLPLAWFAIFDDLHRVEPVAEDDAARGHALAGVRVADPLIPPAEAGHVCGGSLAVAGFEPDIDERRYRSDLAAIRELIAAGATYQVNYSTRLRRGWDTPPEALYRKLARGQRGAYHGYIETPDWAIACASPELFFLRDVDRIYTRPMKGTARRGRNSAEDCANAAGLQGSEKERAENLIVVDLLRNDLSRVAALGSVRVDELFALERYPTVWQLTSTVSCDVEPSTGLADLFGALFPCGSVTGAPKPSTMAIIATLEASPRGPYCGAIGFVAPPAERTRARFAVGIRTAVVDRAAGIAEYGVGSGVTWYSEASAEWAELRAKAAVLGGS